MLNVLRRWSATLRDVRFCESCAEVCTAECRSQAHLDRVHTYASQQQFPVIR